MSVPPAADAIVVRSPIGLRPDPERVVGQLFVPGHALAGESEGRVSSAVAHVLELSDAAVDEALDEIVERFGGRHRALTATFERHARRLADRVAPDVELSERRRLLLGATFTQEYAVEAAVGVQPQRRSGRRPDRSRTG